MAEEITRVIRQNSTTDEEDNIITSTNFFESDNELLTSQELDMLFSSENSSSEIDDHLLEKLNNSINLKSKINESKSQFALKQIERYIAEEDLINWDNCNERKLYINSKLIASINFYSTKYSNSMIHFCSLEAFKLILSFTQNKYASYIPSKPGTYINIRLWLYDNNYDFDFKSCNYNETFIVKKE